MKQVDALSIQRILISRTDSIGDVVLTLPLCVWLKKQFPNVYIIFLGRTYTEPVISCLPEVDEIVDLSKDIKEEIEDIADEYVQPLECLELTMDEKETGS